MVVFLSSFSVNEYQVVLCIAFMLCLHFCIELKRSVCVSISVCQTEELVMSPTTDEAQKAFSDLTTVGLLQQELQ